MPKEKNLYIPFFVDDKDALRELDDAERGRLFTACLEYAETGIAPELTGNERFLFPMFQGRIDRFFANRDEKREKNSANARRRYETQGVVCESNDNGENDVNGENNTGASESVRPHANAYDRMHKKTEANIQSNIQANIEAETKESPSLSPPCAAAQEGTEKEISPAKPKEQTASAMLDELAAENGFSEALTAKLHDWLEYKRERKDKPYTSKSFKALIGIVRNNVAQYGEQAVCDVIDVSMASCYQGITWDKLKQKGVSKNGGTAYNARADTSVSIPSKGAYVAPNGDEYWNGVLIARTIGNDSDEYCAAGILASG